MRDEIEARHYRPFREGVAWAVADALASGARVVHVSVHTFTPVLGERPRLTDIGLLYDPRRTAERAFVGEVERALGEAAPALRIRRNQPYRGVADGMATFLRGLHPDPLYSGLELEVSEGLLTPRGRLPLVLVRVIVGAIAGARPSR
jgi:predicted N-formylglutamate amidohydrolase